MKNCKLVLIGGVGTTLALICCFTPFLPVVLGGLGLTFLMPILYNDLVLLPLAFIFLCLFSVGLWRMYRGS